MSNIYMQTRGPDDWKSFLAEPEKQWKIGYSAHALANCWENAKGLPVEISTLLGQTFGSTELLLAIPEFKVALPGGRRESQNDLFCLLNVDGTLMVVMIEGKVEEPFGPTIADWSRDASDGKRERLSFLISTLGLGNVPPHIRYQLLHRTASAILTAKRFAASRAAMIVHSFSSTQSWFSDFQNFASLYDFKISPGELAQVRSFDDPHLYLGWTTGRLPT